MTYTFKKALGGHIGNSICEEDKLDLALDILKIAKEKGVNLVLSNQTLAADAFSQDAHTQIVDPMNIPDGWEGLDIGPETRKEFAKIIENSKTILWNGPVGVFEIPKFAEGTKAIAEAIVKATEKGAFSLIGGGDSVAAINQFGLADKVSYVSTEAVHCSNISRVKSSPESRLSGKNNTGSTYTKGIVLFILQTIPFVLF